MRQGHTLSIYELVRAHFRVPQDFFQTSLPGRLSQPPGSHSTRAGTSI
jgi:hypothetical protein